MESEPVKEYVPEQQSERPHSRRAIASFVFSILFLLSSIVIIATPDVKNGSILYPVFCLCVLVWLVGVFATPAYGIACFGDKNSKKIFGILGLVFFVISLILLYVFGNF